MKFDKIMQVAWEDFNNNVDTKLTLADLLPSYVPYKGVGGIHIIGSVDVAEQVLKEHVGEYEFDEYYPRGFISNQGVPNVYYGKFSFDDLEKYINNLYTAGIFVLGARFYNE